VAVRM